MIKKTQKKEGVVKPIENIKSHTPSKQPGARVPSSDLLNFSYSSSKTPDSKVVSAEPVRMSVKLEDIIKGSRTPVKSYLKSDLIEPETESVLCTGFELKSSSRVLSGGKLIGRVKKKEIGRAYLGIGELCLEKMNNECRMIEKDLMKDRRGLEEAEWFIGNLFGCKFKLRNEACFEEMPSKVVLKGVNGFEVFDVIKY